MNELLTYGMMLQLHIVAYVQYVIMLIELQNAKSGPTQCLRGKYLEKFLNQLQKIMVTGEYKQTQNWMS